MNVIADDLRVSDIIVGDVGAKLDYRIPRLITHIKEICQAGAISHRYLFCVTSLDADGVKRTVCIMPEEMFRVIRR